MTLYIEQECAVNLPFDYQQLANDVIKAALDEKAFPFEAEVNLLFVSTERIQEINQEFRQIAAVTDVLSFPMLAYESPGDFSWLLSKGVKMTVTDPHTGNILLGDIVLCIPKVEEQAKVYGHSSKREFAFLILHSMLHLFGYDHVTKAGAQTMEEIQNAILEKMEITR